MPVESKPLAGVNVLVTRPQGQGQGLLAAIEKAGGCASHYPVMAISTIACNGEQWQQCKQLVLRLDQFQHVIFISTNAVHFGMDWINQYWPQLPVGIHWYGIGKKTIAELIAMGVPVENRVEGGAMNSEGLLQAQSLQQLEGQNVLIVRGVGGREALQTALTQRGGRVDYAECYQREIVSQPVGEIAEYIQQRQIDTVCVNSGESLQNFCRLLGAAVTSATRQLSMVVPGKRVAALAVGQGFKNVVVAENASDQSMLAALRQHCQQQREINKVG